MIVVSEAKQMIRNGATFAKMSNRLTTETIYWLKFPWANGFEISNKTGRYLEKNGYKPKIWPWDI